MATGRVTRLQAGGFASQAEAQRACSSLQRAGQDCLVTNR
ncbi:MAG: SPOR domain-containing protein [Alteraurantiacibacter sp.]